MDMFVVRRALTTTHWINLIVNKNLTRADMDNAVVRATIRFDGIRSKTLNARIFAVVKIVELNIINKVRKGKTKCFGLRWSHGLGGTISSYVCVE